MNNLGGSFSINQTGRYTVHVDYASNSTESQFVIVPKTRVISYNETSKNDEKTVNPLGVTALVIYHPFLGCLSSNCPPNNFYLKINSNSSAYLFGYDICNGNSCIRNNTLSVPLPSILY